MTQKDTIEIDACWNKKGVWSQNSELCLELLTFKHCRNCPTYSESGRKLLDRPLSKDYQQELINIYRKNGAQKRETTKSAFVFKAGPEWLALQSYIVSEVVYMGPIHSIPHRNSRIFRGIVNVRGRLELCVSLGGVLRIEGRSREQRGTPTPERLIVAIKKGQSVVFPVTKVIGTTRYTQSMVSPLPITVSGAKAIYTKSILTCEGRDIGFLDDNLLFRILTRNLS